MRKHDVRKWLHAILDLLPVIIIPVFMVYSHRHTIDTYAITTPKYDTIDMQQNVVNGKPINLDGWVIPSSATNVGFTNGYLRFEYNDYENPLSFETNTNINFPVNDEEIVYFSVNFANVSSNFNISLVGIDETLDINFNELNTGVNKCYTTYSGPNEIFSHLEIVFDNFDGLFGIKDIQFMNITQMFGSGNEPTIEEFNALFPNEYYPVDSTASALYENGTQTYNETDIGSQMFYCLYNSVDKYFNMGNVFGLTGVYKWFELNIFHGQAPLSMYVVWNIVLYEFVMDLLFLLYGLFMWFIDMIEKIMDKPFKSIK